MIIRNNSGILPNFIISTKSMKGLGQIVLQGVGRLDVGLAALGGLGIVLLAIMLDQFTQAIANY